MSLPLLIIYAAELVMQNADVILLAMYRPPGEVGMYFAAAKTMALVMFVHYAVGSAVAHRFSALKARGDEAGLKRAVARRRALDILALAGRGARPAGAR